MCQSRCGTQKGADCAARHAVEGDGAVAAPVLECRACRAQRLSAPRVRSLQRPPPESGPGTKLSMTHGLWLVAWGVGGL